MIYFSILEVLYVNEGQDISYLIREKADQLIADRFYRLGKLKDAEEGKYTWKQFAYIHIYSFYSFRSSWGLGGTSWCIQFF